MKPISREQQKSTDRLIQRVKSACASGPKECAKRVETAAVKKLQPIGTGQSYTVPKVVPVNQPKEAQGT
ncbi:hypothetical protein MA16_Dca013274 [Dendrobium catenatum]|uniref:Uncharacterized protein n=1 Tax=Dendrobium catenatum TaxID=906689 RepID=A0A2I0V9Q9_9ASPA|nr:hypothetical protein MA16_Dca029081 [Dendrobium catenatum]PKU73694.1 hypothetical protein MA16_Dca013274 [Dendrobium catenatum]